MKYYSALLLIFYLFTPSWAQSSTLVGEWILDDILYADGKDLEINHSLFSTQVKYVIAPNSLKISSQSFKASFTHKEIKTDFRSFTYSFEDKYLKIQESGDKKILYFLRPKDFVALYPEFKMEVIIRGNDTLCVANELTDYKFIDPLTLEEFVRKNMTERNSDTYEKLYFKIEFILTKNNKIKDIKVLNSISDSYDNEYIRAIQKSEKGFINKTSHDLLIIKEANHLKFYNDLTDKDEKQLYDLMNLGDKYYYKNKFEEAIVAYSKIKLLNIQNNNFKVMRYDALIKLGISQLAVGKQAEACESFKAAGNNTDFRLRNYINKFCN